MSRSLRGFGAAAGLAVVAAVVVGLAEAGKRKEEPETAQDVQAGALGPFWDFVVQVLSLKRPYSLEFLLWGFTTWMAYKFRCQERVQAERYFWLTSLVRTVIACYGGGCVVPMMLGMKPFPIENDSAITLVLFSWWTLHGTPAPLVTWVLDNSTVLRCFLYFIFEALRCNVVVKWCIVANSMLAPSAHYPIPIWGPILCGGLSGCFGGFILGGVGLVQSEVSWLIQSSFYAAAYYHIAVNDPIVGPILGKFHISGAGSDPLVARMTCILALGIIAVLQEAFFGAHFNPFAPIHHLIYKITGAHNPAHAETGESEGRDPKATKQLKKE